MWGEGRRPFGTPVMPSGLQSLHRLIHLSSCPLSPDFKTHHRTWVR